MYEKAADSKPLRGRLKRLGIHLTCPFINRRPTMSRILHPLVALSASVIKA